MIRDYHTYVFAAKKHLFENPFSVRTDFIIHLEGLRLQAFQNLSLNQKQESHLKDKRRKKYRYIGTQKYSTIPRNLQTPIWSVGSINIDEENFKKVY